MHSDQTIKQIIKKIETSKKKVSVDNLSTTDDLPISAAQHHSCPSIKVSALPNDLKNL
jgi:hypothetical protein